VEKQNLLPNNVSTSSNLLVFHLRHCLISITAFLSLIFRLSANCDTTSRGEHASGNVHARQFLEEQFCRVWNVYLGDLGRVFAGPAFELLPLEIAIKEIG
jgi:hypothetical protein